MFGGWKTTFTIGYGLPLQDFLFGLDGKRFLNISFGAPIYELVIDTLFVKVTEFILSFPICISLLFIFVGWKLGR